MPKLSRPSPALVIATTSTTLGSATGITAVQAGTLHTQTPTP